MGNISKIYKTGLVVGRFQIFHTGHEELVRTALALCKKTLLMIGSSQEAMTEKNPLSYEQRRGMISDIFKKEIDRGRLMIVPLPDIGAGNVPAWGNYVLEQATKALGEAPELLVSGKEERRVNWFDGPDAQVTELYVPKKIDISATELRAAIINGDRAMWQAYTNSSIASWFDTVRGAVVASLGNTGTASL